MALRARDIMTMLLDARLCCLMITMMRYEAPRLIAALCHERGVFFMPLRWLMLRGEMQTAAHA